MKLIKTIKDKLYTYETNLMLLFIAILVLVSFLQVLLRKFFNSGIPDSEKIITMMVFYIALIGASAATLKNKHISVEVLSNFVSKKVNNVFNILSSLFAIFITFLLYYYGLEYIEGQQANMDEFIFSIKTTEAEAFMLPCFLLMLIGFILNLIENILILMKKDS